MCWYLFLCCSCKEMAFGKGNARVFLYSILESSHLAAHPQASISGATGSTGKQHSMGTEILTNDELTWISGHLGTGTGPFLQNRPARQSPRTQLQSVGHTFPDCLHSCNIYTCLPREEQSISLPTPSPPSRPLEKLWLPPESELHNSSPLYFLSTGSWNARDHCM